MDSTKVHLCDTLRFVLICLNCIFVSQLKRQGILSTLLIFESQVYRILIVCDIWKVSFIVNCDAEISEEGGRNFNEHFSNSFNCCWIDSWVRIKQIFSCQGELGTNFTSFVVSVTWSDYLNSLI